METGAATTGERSGTPVLRVTGVSKRYGAVQALSGADFVLAKGEVHALVGENGAGKSTLSRIIAGMTQADEGRITFGGEAYAPASRRDAEKLGVRMVMQELNLIPTLTVAESIFLQRLPHRFGWISARLLRDAAAGVLKRVGLVELDPVTPISALGIGQQQLVEIAAGLSGRCDVLILDEPTAALTDTEIDLLFTQIKRLQADGTAILYISHRMEEIARIADRITVLRDGKIIGTRENRAGQARGGLLAEIIQMMVGRDLGTASFRPSAPGYSAAPALSVRGLSSGPVRNVRFDVHRGEILGLAGLMGSGRTETLRAIFGADSKSGGDLFLHGSHEAARIRSPSHAVAAGIALLTEDRKGEGLLLPWTVRANVTVTSMRSVRSAVGWINRRREGDDATALATRLRLRCASIEQPVRELSGGNQQKVVVAKWLYRNCDILLFDEPTRGIDVGAKFEIYNLLRELAQSGKAILVVSSELPELFAICNRIAVLSAGTLVRTFDAADFDQDAVMRAALENY